MKTSTKDNTVATTPYQHQPPRDGEPLRVIMLASNFPKPGRERMGVWAMSQAQALRRQGVELTVVSLTSWVPRALGRLSGSETIRAWTSCPAEHSWDGLRVLYPRWSLYQKGAIWQHAFRNPGPHLALAWASASKALLRAVDEVRPHALYVHYTLPNGELARRIRELRGVPYVLTDHGRGEIDECEHMPARRRTFGAVLDGASTWTGVSTPMLRSVERLFPGTPAAVIPNGADPLPAEVFAAPRPPEIQGKTVVFSAGGFYPIKGFPDLVRAFAKVAPRYPDAVLRIVGDGSYRPQVEEAIRETGLAERVQLLGSQLHARTLQEMAWADIFALLSWNESFGVVFLEAAAAGMPVIWTDDVGAADGLRDGVDGRMVKPRDIDGAAAALDALLGDPDARRRMGESAQKNFLDHLTWDACARKTISLLRSAALSPR